MANHGGLDYASLDFGQYGCGAAEGDPDRRWRFSDVGWYMILFQGNPFQVGNQAFADVWQVSRQGG
jgi:hypothetical protein